MTVAREKLLQDILSLPQSAREALIDALVQSLEPIEITDAWKQEVLKRIRKIESGQAVLHDAASHLEDLLAKYSAP